MKKMKKIIRNALYFIVITTLIAEASTSKPLPIHIEADSGFFNHTTGVGVYEGHVRVTQGENLLTATKILTFSDKQDNLVKLVASGHDPQCYYETKPISKPRLIASADTITYYPPTQQVALAGRSHAEQGANSIDGSLLLYDMTAQTLTSSQVAHSRTTITIRPSSS